MKSVVLTVVCALGSLVALFPCRAVAKSSGPDLSRVEAGAAIFSGNCAVCHSIKPGEKLVGPSLYDETAGAHPRMTDAQVQAIVLSGEGRMPSFKGTLSSENTRKLLAYLRTLDHSSPH